MLSIIILSIILLFLSILSIKRGGMSVKVTSIKNRSIDIINYTIPYMLAFLGIDLSKPEDIICVILFLLILLILTINSKSVFINPLLVLAGYGLYDLEYEFDGKTSSTIIISRIDVRKGGRYYIRSLSRFLYFVTQEIK